MSQQDLQIRLKVEEMILYAYAPLRNFPKAEKHVLSADIHQQLSSWIAHARHGEALPAISKYLQDHPFRREL